MKKIIILIYFSIAVSQTSGLLNSEGLTVGGSFSKIYTVDSDNDKLEIDIKQIGASYLFPEGNLELAGGYSFSESIYNNPIYSTFNFWEKSYQFGGTYYMRSYPLKLPINFMFTGSYTNSFAGGNVLSLLRSIYGSSYHLSANTISLSGGFFTNVFSAKDLNVIVYGDISSISYELTEEIDYVAYKETNDYMLHSFGFGLKYMNLILVPGVIKNWESGEIYYIINFGINISKLIPKTTKL